MNKLPRWRKPSLLALAAVMAIGVPTLGSPTAQASTAVTANDLIAPMALDGRLADDGVTPIAVNGGTNAAGDQIVYGARPSTTPAVADLTRTIDGTRHFVDCSATDAGDGSQAAPLTTLAEVNALELEPGDEVLFRRGSACTGSLEPKGSGTAEAPVVIDAYDAEATSMARIDGNGAVQTVLLHNVSHYEIRNLEITNFTGDDRDYQPQVPVGTNSAGSTPYRRGLTVMATDTGLSSGFKITDLYIHDVLSNNLKQGGGIYFSVRGGVVKTKFSDVEVAHNTIRHVNRSGINMETTWWSREEAELWGERSHYPWDPFHIHDNFLTDIGGDGIVVQYASGSKVEHNTVEDAANEHGGKSANGVNVAVWPWNADRVEFRNNHVFGTFRSMTNNDGSAFNADSGNTGGIYEHNLSHGNEGGFMMWCGCWGMTTDITVRYNVSLNDGTSKEVYKNWRNPSLGTVVQPARINLMYGQTDGKLYNNTYLLPVDNVDIAFPDQWLADNAVHANNVFLAQEGTVVNETTTALPKTTVYWRNNIFGGTDEGWPTLNSDANQVLPDLALVDGVGLDRLKFTGSEFAAAGYPIAEAGTTDMLDNPVPSTTDPDIGAWQFSSFDDAATLADGGFENNASWTLSGSAAVVADGARNGRGALEVGVDGTAVATAKAAINRTYRLVAAVKADGAEAPQVQVELPGGHVATATAHGEAGADGYVPVTATFRTAWNATTFDVRVVGGSGLVDDITVEGVEDHVVDGAFEALLNTVWQPPSPIEGTPGNSFQDDFPRSTDAVTGTYATPVPVKADPLIPATNRFTFVTPGVDYELGVWAKATDDVSLIWFSEGGEEDSISSTEAGYTRLTLPLRSSSEQVTIGCDGEGFCDDITLVEAFDGQVPAVLSDTPVDPEPTATPTATPTAKPTVTPTSTPTSPSAPATDLYSTPGLHHVNGRHWSTTCEPYSQTFRCTTEIWATQTTLTGGKFTSTTGWHFNNLTYLPLMTRAQWVGNPLGTAGEWTSAEGRKWRTECDTAATGRGGCRSWVWSSYVSASQDTAGAWTYQQDQGWVVNNIVRFR